MSTPKRFLTKQEAAETLGVTVNCLNIWHGKGTGPIRTKVGTTRVYYAVSDIEAFLAEGRKRELAERERRAAAQRRKVG